MNQEDDTTFSETVSQLGKHGRDEELLLGDLDEESRSKRLCKTVVDHHEGDGDDTEHKASNSLTGAELDLPSVHQPSVSELLRQPAPPAHEVFAVEQEIAPDGDSVLTKESLTAPLRSEPASQARLEPLEPRPLLDSSANQLSPQSPILQQPQRPPDLAPVQQPLSYQYMLQSNQYMLQSNLLNCMGNQQTPMLNSQYCAQDTSSQGGPPNTTTQTTQQPIAPFFNPIFMFPPMFNSAFPLGTPQPNQCHRGISLSLACDRDHLSEYQSLVRKQLELFEARPEDVDSVTQGRKKQVVLGQVGIRCIHCSGLPLPGRDRGSVYYPMTLNSIYQAAQNMAQTHLSQSCKHIPDKLKKEIRRLRERRGVACGGKKYWTSCAQAVGLIETSGGLRLRKEPSR